MNVSRSRVGKAMEHVLKLNSLKVYIFSKKVGFPIKLLSSKAIQIRDRENKLLIYKTPIEQFFQGIQMFLHLIVPSFY